MFYKRKASHLLIGFFCLIAQFVSGQNQKLADSLALIYNEGNIKGIVKLELLRNLSFNEMNDLELALKYADKLINLSEKQQNYLYQYRGYLQKGYIKRTMGDLDEALDAFINGVDASKKANYISGEGTAYGAIADIYIISKNYSNAILYYDKAIVFLRQSDDSVALATNILNAGDGYLVQQQYDSALLYFMESGIIFEQLNHQIGKAYNLGNIGMVYANIGENVLAEKNINEAIAILEKSGNFHPICFYLISMSDIYLEKEELPTALNYGARSLKLAEQYKLKQQISDANLKLSELYEKINNPEEAFKYYRNHIIYRDSVNNVETIQNMADQRTEFEVDLREKAIDLLEKSQSLDRTYIITALTLLILSVVLLLYFRQRFLNTKLVSISEKKHHDEKIKDLLNKQETKALQSMVQGRDNERKRLAQELHNHFGSLLATIKVNINGIEEDAIPNHHTITTLVDQACSDIRNMSHVLNMGISENFGLVPALKELTTHLRESGDLKVEFSASMCEGQLDSECEILTYRIVQELVSNVLKHAKATKLSIALICYEEDKLINIMVHDNGKGFNTKKTHNNSNGMGLKSLKKMITDQQGEIKFDSHRNSGTTITIDLPLVTDINFISS